jgi:hypothetical protein
MDIIQQLPDDIILYIYTKCLKRYRLYEGKLIKLIDLDKYKFLEKYIHRRINNFYGSETNYYIKYQLSNLSDVDRKDSYIDIDDDMICINITINDGLLRYNVDRFRLKKIKDYTQSLPSIYYRGSYKDYDWEVVSYAYEI